MILSVAYSVCAPRETVFAALIDPAVIQRCIDVCEKLVATGEDPAGSGASTYDAHFKIGAARMKGSYAGKVQLKDMKPPESFTLVVEGKGGPGFIKGTANITLTDKGNATELHCDADVHVGGLIAAVGSRLIETAAKKMLDQFFQKFTEQL